MTNTIRSNFQDHPFHLVSPSPWPYVWFGKSPIYRVKLSNSGDTLKPLIPNLVWKYINGWSNKSCTVISQWILESWIGNRGSKSVFCNILSNYLCVLAVKEQRVNGSYIEKNSILKCTLMGFEKSYQVRILPKQIIILRSYSTGKIENNLNPWFATGIVDAEGCFTLNIHREVKQAGM